MASLIITEPWDWVGLFGEGPHSVVVVRTTVDGSRALLRLQPPLVAGSVRLEHLVATQRHIGAQRFSTGPGRYHVAVVPIAKPTDRDWETATLEALPGLSPMLGDLKVHK